MKTVDFEILIATMNRTDLSFLFSMFKAVRYDTYPILIINQTTKDKLLESPYKNIRVINSFEKGLSKSRNLAIAHAVGAICLIADDDVCFTSDFQQRIIEAYTKYPDASVICFQTVTPQGKLYSNYAKAVHRLNRRNIKKILSVEVSFKRNSICHKNITFNEWFGLGGVFEDSETYFFLMDVVKAKINALYYPAAIVVHEHYSSSDKVESDRIIHARAAAFYKVYKKRAYFLVLKYLFFLWRKRYIKAYELRSKFKTGIKGITRYKQLYANALKTHDDYKN